MRILFLSDTHLGFDLPFRPRVERRRRGPDFFKNLDIALEPAHRGEVDAVVHGGDLLFRSKVPAKLVQMAFESLMKTAETGIPIYLVPGNHERSAIPYRILSAHPNIHIFDRPRTFLLEKGGTTLALAGFPYVRENIRGTFPQMVKQTGINDVNADAAVLCMHHCVEGATLIMGNRSYTFRDTHDVVSTVDITGPFAAVLSGHIHRFQVLTRDLRGRELPVPVFYPGSIERTSFTEKDEAKGYLTLDIAGETNGATSAGGYVKKWTFHPLPARPMKVLELNTRGKTSGELELWLRSALERLPEDAVVKIRIHGRPEKGQAEFFKAERLRELTPSSMNLTLSQSDFRVR
ncbi:MAG: metallophosphoesterase [bacterium]|nr:metallophosphoesterase [bacterium]